MFRARDVDDEIEERRELFAETQADGGGGGGMTEGELADTPGVRETQKMRACACACACACVIVVIPLGLLRILWPTLGCTVRAASNPKPTWPPLKRCRAGLRRSRLPGDRVLTVC